MNRFESIRVQGYRRICDSEIKLRPLSVLIGANGVGKTSFLEVWTLLAAASSSQLSKRLSELGGLANVLTRDRAQNLVLDVSMTVPQQAPLAYHVEITQQGSAYQVSEELLSQQNQPSPSSPMKHIESRGLDIRYYDRVERKLLRPNWPHNPLETSLAQVPKMFQEPENLRQQLASCVCYGALDVAPTAPVRLPQPLRPATLPGMHGEELVSCLFQLRETGPDRFEVLEDTLRAAFPTFDRLLFPPVAAGVLALTWKDRDFSQAMYMHQLSEGTLRFLWLVTLLLSHELPTITLLDEPEVSMHPELLRLLVDLMREATQRTHLVVATHSDRLIRFLKPEEVLVADIQNGVTQFTWGSDMDIEHWLSDYSLDQLWQMGCLGGRA